MNDHINRKDGHFVKNLWLFQEAREQVVGVEIDGKGVTDRKQRGPAELILILNTGGFFIFFFGNKVQGCN